MTASNPLGMDPALEADPADMAEQLRSVDPALPDDETGVPASDPSAEADDGDLLEQELPVPDSADDYRPE
jgi:hypothetical protein